MSASSDSLEQDILAAETAVWQALVDGDAEGDAASLCDSFIGIYADGFASKSDHVGQVAHGPTVAWFDITTPHFRALGDGHAVISYAATFQRAHAAAPEAMYVTSIWERQAGTWINILSQDTPQVSA